MAATYTKLRSGDWGIRVDGTVKKGDVVKVVKKSGESKEERVDSVVFSGNGISLCAIARARRQGGGDGFAGRRTGCRCGSIEGRPRDSDCRQCQYDNE